MRTTLPKLVTPWLLMGLLGLTVAGHADEEDGVLTSVFSRTDKNYRRFKEPSGKWERQSYAMVNGGAAAGTIRDNAQESIPFAALATVVAEHLGRQRYFPATDPDKVDLLLVVNWGKTRPFSDPTYQDGLKNVTDAMNTMSMKNQAAARADAVAGDAGQSELTLTGSVQKMEAQAADSYLQNAMIMQDMINRARNQSNSQTALLLGYLNEINKADGPQRYAGGGNLYDDLVADIEDARYYVIISAYDFQQTVRGNKPKLQWVTRMSMRAPGNSFAENAATMIAYAASRFGRNSNGLERKLYPKYAVNLEDVRFLGAAANAPAEEEPVPQQLK